MIRRLRMNLVNMHRPVEASREERERKRHALKISSKSFVGFDGWVYFKIPGTHQVLFHKKTRAHSLSHT